MSRRPNHLLRTLTNLEREALDSISRSRTEPAEHVTRARTLLVVAAGASFSYAARSIGREIGDAVGAYARRASTPRASRL